MRSLLTAALALALAAPAFAQTTPASEIVSFEGLGTPIAYKPGVPVPESARVKSVALAGGGTIRFRTKGGASYVGLVTHFGTTAIAAVNNNGKIADPAAKARYVEMWIKKSRGARLDSFVAMQAGTRIDTKGTTDPADDETFYDNPGSGVFQLYDSDKNLYPPNGQALSIVRAVDPLEFVKDSYDLTTTSLDFVRILIRGDLVYDDLVVSYGH